MVNFAVFNELSLPLAPAKAHEIFASFFSVLKKLKTQGLTQIKFNDAFKNYNITKGTSFQEFLGKQTDRDFRTRLKSFANNTAATMSSQITEVDRLEQKETVACNEYFYSNQQIDGGLAWCAIWNTIAISFNSAIQWDKYEIIIQKNTLEDDRILESNVVIRHASESHHLDHHQIFFKEVSKENIRQITKENFWSSRNEAFPSVIEFCPEVEEQIKKLETAIIQQAFGILREIEKGLKNITDFNWSSESETVRNTPKLKALRTFTVNKEKVFFQNHLKCLPNGNRIYFLAETNKIFIGYIGKHLPTKKHK